MSTATAAPPSNVITARIVSVDGPNERGWYRITTDGTPKSLQTKDVPKAEEAGRLRAAGGLCEIRFLHRPRHDPESGRTYDNFFYEKGREAQQSLPIGIDPPSENAGTRGKTNPGDAWRIALSVGSERAVTSLAYLPEDQRDFETTWRLAYQWATRIFQTPPPPPRTATGNGTEQSFRREAEQTFQQTYQEPPPDASFGPSPDDDIPF